MTVDDREDRSGQLMLFRQVTEGHDRGFIKHRGTKSRASELVHRCDLVECLLHDQIAQGE